MSLAEIIPPALRFFDVQHQVKIFGNGEPRSAATGARVAPNTRYGLDWRACALTLSTHVPFFSWRKGPTLWLNGTCRGGAVHSCAPRLRPGCGALFLDRPAMTRTNFRGTRLHSRTGSKYGAASQVPTTWFAGSTYAAFFTAVDSSFPGKVWARSSEAMQIKKQTTLTSNRFRFDRFTAKNSVLAMLRCNKPPDTNAIQPA